ncbi:hypothetical protein D3C72_1998620 [compost metagenome]
MSFSSPRSQLATSAPNTANGTAVSTAIGSVQRSYCAARIRNTITSAITNTVDEAPPVDCSWNAEPVHARV